MRHRVTTSTDDAGRFRWAGPSVFRRFHMCATRQDRRVALCDSGLTAPLPSLPVRLNASRPRDITLVQFRDAADLYRACVRDGRPEGRRRRFAGPFTTTRPRSFARERPKPTRALTSPRSCHSMVKVEDCGMWGRAVLLVVALGVSGCAAQQQESRMTKALDRWIGQSVASFVAERGDPTSSVKLAERENAFRWVLTGQGAGGVVPIGDSMIIVPPRRLICTVTLTATTGAKNPELKDWIITKYSWQGAC